MLPQQRANMLAGMSKALASGGTLLFVSHDKSGPIACCSEEDLSSLTTPEEIVAELPELHIEQAFVLDDDATSGHVSPMNQDCAVKTSHEAQDSPSSRITIVKAFRP